MDSFRPVWAFAVFALFAANTGADEPAKKPAAQEVARRVDKLLLRGRDPATPLPALADDADFLRRLSLDLTGKIPSPGDMRAFIRDADPHKRVTAIDRLLKSDAYAVNWGRYWRDVLTYHTPASGNYLRWKLWDGWWTEQIKHNRPWNEVVSELVTSSGVNDETAPVNYLTALYGNPVEI